MPHVLITGANRGIGLALTKQYLDLGWQVTASCRELAKATELTGLNCPQLHYIELDITDYPAVSQLADNIEAIDLLINNAGYYGPKGYGFGNTDVEQWRQVFEINTIAPLKMVELLYPKLAAGQGKTIVCLSSKVGSMTENTSGGGYIYRSSKAALNSVVKSLHNDLSAQGYKVAALHPGWVQTEMGGPNALIDTKTSAQGLIAVIEGLDASQSGGFYDYRGESIGW